MDRDNELVDRIIARFGPVIDLVREPHVIIDILRTYNPFASEPGVPDGGLPPGGTPPPPGPTSLQGHVLPEELMREVLALKREVTLLRKAMPAAPRSTAVKKTVKAPPTKAKKGVKAKKATKTRKAAKGRR
jgi:hypothetical protein